MIFRFHKPAAPLGEFVEHFWYCSDIPSHRRERILPTGTIELVINLREDEVRIFDSAESDCCVRYSGAVVSGAYRGCLTVDPMQHASMIGVHFSPGGAFPFLGAPADRLTDLHLDLERLWGPIAGELRERLCAAATVEQRFALLEAMLVSRLRQRPERHSAVPVALDLFEQTGGAASVHEVARRVGLSQRRFIQVFSAEVGLTPKLYGRVRRFRKASDLARTADAPDWAQIAVDCGYFDQSHLIRDFQAFAGLTPGNYFRSAVARVMPNHVPQTD